MSFDSPVTKRCAACSVEFSTHTYGLKYCTKPECRQTASTCTQCGAPFSRPHKQMAKVTGQFCSTKCYYAWPGKRYLKPKNCPVCSKEFGPRKATQTYCSWACRYASQVSAKRNKTCAQCGIAMSSEKRRTAAIYCSQQCANARGLGGRSSGQKILPVGSTKVLPSEYVVVRVKPGHPMAYRGDWYIAHRVAAEKVLGRYLARHEKVHHRNGNRADNTAGPCLTSVVCNCGVVPKHNLELWKIKSGSLKDPQGIRASDYHCPGCRCHEPR